MQRIRPQLFLIGKTGGLSDLFGIICEETDTLYPTDKNGIAFENQNISPENWKVKDYADLLRIKDAEIASERTSAENFQKHMIFCGNKLCKTDSPDQTRRNRLVNRKKLRLPLRREAPGSKIPQRSGAKS